MVDVHKKKKSYETRLALKVQGKKWGNIAGGFKMLFSCKSVHLPATTNETRILFFLSLLKNENANLSESVTKGGGGGNVKGAKKSPPRKKKKWTKKKSLTKK